MPQLLRGQDRVGRRWLRLLAVVAVSATAGCAVPSDPINPPLALTRSGEAYSIRLAGTCTYPEQASVSVRVSDTGRTLWRARLRAGSTATEIQIGDSASVLSTEVPFAGLPQGQRISILAGSPGGSWENEFLLPIAEGQLNGGRMLGDRSVDLARLNQDVHC